MKILVLSDSHGRISGMEDAVRLEKPDLIYHLGDYARDAEQLQFFHIPVLFVAGNCDYGAQSPQLLLDEEEGVRIFACHGHRYQVKSGLTSLSFAAREKGARLCLFGHTHTAFCEESGGIQFLNPGSCGGSRPTYGTVLLEQGNIRCRLHAISEESEVNER